jgi:superfamily II DNA or RNA helicase
MNFRRKFNYANKKTIPKKIVNEKPQIIELTDEYKQQILEKAYLGKKGYTIPKEVLSKDDDEFLRKDLFVKPMPFGGGTVFGGAQEENAFPVYRENTNKIYIPRFYGIARYGLPHKSEIDPGKNISLQFPKELRDYQDKIVNIYTDYVKTPICIGADFTGNGGILEVPCGRGKCLGKNTPILMYDGTIKLVQDVCVGELLMGDDSTPRKVLSLARGREMMYKVNGIGSSYIVNESHILSLKSRVQDKIVDIEVADYLELPEYTRNGLFGYRVPIIFEQKPIEIDPYLFGQWLGNKSEKYEKYPIELFQFLEKYNIVNNKHIPHHYKCNKFEIQMELFLGMIDSYSGSFYDESYHIDEPDEILANDIIFLARSIGYSVNKDRRGITITGGDVIELTYPIQLDMMGVDDYYGFEIDGNRRFLLGDFTVTHNTVMALKIISLLSKKTLIIVHKEFLMNQWIERIEEFLPGAMVGKIQGPVFDVAGKDIVIGMIQTLYDKEYPANTFSEFGLTIIDEVHRIGSEQFSRTLFKTITPYMLGISATVDRKDKLTRVLHMFIGDKIYTEKREDEDTVCVRAIEYKTNDTEFNTTEYDFRGTPKYSTMITKLCAYGPRSDFIVRVIGDLIEENPENQIMILCHNRSLLTYLYDAIQYRKIASVGYYVGGMKQCDLQTTETRQIVLATYAMAAEALDIKSLSTLVMVTPKTDIIQSVGRILRVRHENPIVVDILDSHDLFQNQWKQRRQFYKKCNYRIRQINSLKYNGMKLNWDEDKTWIAVYEPKQRISTSCEEDEGESKFPKNPILSRKCMIDFSGLDDTLLE